MEFELASKRNVLPYHSFYEITKFGKFWITRRVVIMIYKLGSVLKK
jgi:hypothetical protein